MRIIDGAKLATFARLPLGRPRFKFILLFFVLCALLILFGTSTQHGRALVSGFPASSHEYLESLSNYLKPSSSADGGCSPEEYASGTWVRRPWWARVTPLSRTSGDEALFDFPEDEDEDEDDMSTSNALGDSGADAESQSNPNPKSNSPDTKEKANTKMKAKEDVLKFARFEGCASPRDYWLQLGVDVEALWDRFPKAHGWEWVPGGRCSGVTSANWGGGGKEKGRAGLREWDKEEFVRDLVEKGGWLLIGDSVTENHFFSLSCLLYPHVIAVPDYRHKIFDRAFPQNLFLNPESPLLQASQNDTSTSTSSSPWSNAKPRIRRPLRLPPGFDPEITPLITYRRVDLLYSKSTLTSLHRSLHPEIYMQDAYPGFALFGEEKTWTMDPEEYLGILKGRLPEANYRAMVVSTGGHWTTGLMRGYNVHGKGVGLGSRIVWGNETELSSFAGQAGLEFQDDGRVRWDSGPERKVIEGSVVLGYDGLLTFFGEVMHAWSAKVQSALDADEGVLQAASSPTVIGKGRRSSAGQVKRVKREVILRPYLPGHVDCHAHREPFGEVRPVEREGWNWQEIWKYNRIFEIILAPYKSLHYLKIERPGRLRPDAHSSHDCLHIMSGAGVLEGWTHYIWHYLTPKV